MTVVASCPQLVLASLGGLTGAVYALNNLVARRRATNPLALDSSWPQWDNFQRELNKEVTDEAVSTLLLERVDKLTGDMTSSRDALDAKASTLLGFLGGGISLLAILAKGTNAAPPITPLLIAGAVGLLLSLIYALAVLWAKGREDQYGLDNFCFVHFLKEPENRARLAAMVAYNGIEKSVGLFADLCDKGWSLTAAQFFFVLGAVLLVLNSFVS
jgi:hypothetical protein